MGRYFHVPIPSPQSSTFQLKLHKVCESLDEVVLLSSLCQNTFLHTIVYQNVWFASGYVLIGHVMVQKWNGHVMISFDNVVRPATRQGFYWVRSQVVACLIHCGMVWELFLSRGCCSEGHPRLRASSAQILRSRSGSAILTNENTPG